MNSRRVFLKNVAAGGALLGLGNAFPVAGSAAPTGCLGKKVALGAGAVVLFQGDSITDAGRSRRETAANSQNALGRGYPLFAGAEILRRFADKAPRVLNRGISGNKVFQLAARWDGEALALKPDVLSILIGVNDHWHTIGGKYKGTPEVYERDYRALLKRTADALPKTRLVICEPFAVNKVRAVTDSWFPVFDKYRVAAKKLAGEFGATFVPFQQVFDDAQKLAPGKYWTPDGVHPSLAGAQLMADAWLKSVFG
jgi:lysophospholipase L1-like esterase